MSYHERARDRRRHARDRLLDERRSRDERHPLEQRHPFDEDPSRRRRRDRHNEDRERRRSRERLRGPTSERRDPLLERSRYHDEGDFFPAADYRGNITSTSAADRALEAAAELTAPSMRRSDRYRPSNRDSQPFEGRNTSRRFRDDQMFDEVHGYSLPRELPRRRRSPSITSGYRLPPNTYTGGAMPEPERVPGHRMGNPQAEMLMDARPYPNLVGTPRPGQDFDDMIEYETEFSRRNR